MKMVCAECNFELSTEQNGIFVIEMADFGPYKIYSADLYKCAGCGKETVAGFATNPYSEHFEDGFQNVLERVKSGRHFYNYGRTGRYKK